MRGTSFDVVVLSTANDEGVAAQGPKGWAHFSSFTHFAREGVVDTGGAGRSDNLQDPQLIDAVDGLSIHERTVVETGGERHEVLDQSIHSAEANR